MLLRLQNHSRICGLVSGDFQGGVVRWAEDMLLIAPDQAELWRQAGIMNQRLEQVAAAKDCYQRFLDLVPEGPVANGVRAQLDILRSRNRLTRRSRSAASASSASQADQNTRGTIPGV